MKTCYNCFSNIPEGTGVCPCCGRSSELRNEEKYPHALPCGTILNGKYIVGSVLGQGGFGITYVGQQFEKKKLVAIKEYFPDTMASRDMSHTVIPFNTDRSDEFEYGKKQFLDEAKTLATFIGSPNIVRVSSYFEEKGTAYFVMEYVRGQSLRQYIASRGGRISWEKTWELLMPVLDALSEVHYRNIVHRDIKPDNIIIMENGSAKLIDFGAARYKHGEKSKSLTAILTPGYAPPEQYYSNGNQGAWTDIYALAATMYFCVTGKTPLDSIERAFKDQLEKPSSLGISIPEFAEASLLKALSVNEKERFQTTYDFRNAVLEGMRQEVEKEDVKSMSSGHNDIVLRENKKKTISRVGWVKKSVLALGAVAFIVVIGYFLFYRNGASDSGTETVRSDKISAKSDETFKQEVPFLSIEKDEENESKDTIETDTLISSSAEEIEKEKPGSIETDKKDPEITDCNIELYNGEYGILSLVAIDQEGFVFNYENTTSKDVSLYSQFLTVDGKQFEDGWIDDELYYGGIADDISAGMPFRCRFYIPDNNINPSSVAGQIQVCDYPDGSVWGTIAFRIGLDGEESHSEPVQGQELYNGEFGILTLTSITENGFDFMYENTSNIDYSLYSEFLVVDGVQYDDEQIDDYTHIGGIMSNVSPKMTYKCSFFIPDNNINASRIAGQIEVCEYPNGIVLGNIAFNTEINLQ